MYAHAALNLKDTTTKNTDGYHQVSAQSVDQAQQIIKTKQEGRGNPAFSMTKEKWICDHCSKKRIVEIDSDGWHLCKKCWPLYHSMEIITKIKCIKSNPPGNGAKESQMPKPTMKKLVKEIKEKMNDASEQWHDGQISNAEFDHLVDVAYKNYKRLFVRNIKED